ncbi:MAG: hypothetical protein M3R24_29045 [Chloroflexota bacterium]|nr:hypothetical protein [Chloroflexota bacterium]
MQLDLSYDDLTPAARDVLRAAMAHAAQRATAEVQPAHILLALLEIRRSLALQLLTALHVELPQLRAVVAATLPPVSGPTSTTPILGSAAQQVVRSAFKEARHLGHYRVDALHLLLALLYDPDCPMYAILSAGGLSLYDLRQQVLHSPRRFRVRVRDTLQATVHPSPVFLVLVATLLGSGAAL